MNLEMFFQKFGFKAVNSNMELLSPAVNVKSVTFKSTKTLFSGMILLLSLVLNGCQKVLEEIREHHSTNAVSYKQTNLVSDTAYFNASILDPTLVNAWGIAINPSGIFWISANGAGLSEVYDKTGTKKRAPVATPSQGMLNGGKPTGQVFNNTPDFIIPANGLAARFIFAGEDGKIYAWNSGDSTRTVALSTTDAVYKGIELAKDGGQNFLYLTDFHNGKIDVYDKNFALVTTKPFKDPYIPAGFAPFNIRLIDSVLYVTYAKQLGPENKDDQKGIGNGFVSLFKTDGKFIKRFASHGKLNSPWGIDKAPEGFGLGKNIILVGNFGDGRINVYEKGKNEFLGQLNDYGLPISIDGLWAITFPDGNVPGDDPNKLYFTAGPFDESHGLFGYLSKR